MTRVILTFQLLTLGLIIVFTSCEKETEATESNNSPITGTRMELTLDSIFLYAQQIYLWNDVIPSYSDFMPRTRYGNMQPEVVAFRTELFDISQLKQRDSGIAFEQNSIPNTPKYSFLEEQTTKNFASLALINTDDYIQKTNIWTIDTKQVGYLYLRSLPELSTVKKQLDEAFETFADQHVSHLIIDLRDNGGGYIKTAQYIADLIVPQNLQGKIMYSELFNSQLQQGKADILKKQLYRDAAGNTVNHNGRIATLADVDFSESANTFLFAKKGKLNSVTTIYFLVSENTASAAEMLISVLKPYFTNKLIGKRTYGKPVGTFPIQIDHYQIYLTSFLIRNAKSCSDYFDGFPVDIEATGSNIPDLGNPEETLLSAAFRDITNKKVLLSRSSKTKEIPKENPIPSTNFVPIYKQSFHLKKDQRY